MCLPKVLRLQAQFIFLHWLFSPICCELVFDDAPALLNDEAPRSVSHWASVESRVLVCDLAVGARPVLS
jgi:hypothetical protein